MCPASTPLEYLEYDELEGEDDDLFGSEPENGPSASGPSTIPTYNTARPVDANKADTLIPPPLTASASSRKGKERARAKDPQDRLDELRFMRIPQVTRPRPARGVMHLRDTTMSGKSHIERLQT